MVVLLSDFHLSKHTSLHDKLGRKIFTTSVFLKFNLVYDELLYNGLKGKMFHLNENYILSIIFLW